MPKLNSGDNIVTLQSNLKSHNTAVDEFTSYAYMLGGINAKKDALAQYDLLRKGYGRLFILKMPTFLEMALPSSTKMFKHMLEFGNTGISGISGYQTEFTSITGGYNGDSIEIPTGAKDDTSSITVKLYETSGSLIRSYVDTWITGAAADPISGLVHYHGASYSNGERVPITQANQIMEAIYVATDQTGEQCVYSCLLTNMFPKSSDHSIFDMDPGSHEIVDMSVEFTAKKYMSAQINSLGQTLVDRFKIMRNSLNFQSGYNTEKYLKTNADTLGFTDTKNIKDWSVTMNNPVNGVF